MAECIMYCAFTMVDAVELREIRVFLTLAEALHFGRAAERLAITPSYVSQTIRRFEARIGGRLLERTSRRVMLTPLGEELKAGLAPAYASLMQVLEKSHESATGVAGTLRLGFTAISHTPTLNRLIQAFQHDYPQCRIELQEVDIFDPYRGLREKTVEVLVSWLAGNEPDLAVGPAISHHDRVLAVARDHHLASSASVSLEQLAGEGVVQFPSRFPAGLHDAIVPPRTPSGRPIRRIQPVRSIHEVLAHIVGGTIVHPAVAGLAVLQRDDIALVPIDDLPPLQLGLIWARSQENAKVLALAETARGSGRAAAVSSSRE